MLRDIVTILLGTGVLVFTILLIVAGLPSRHHKEGNTGSSFDKKPAQRHRLYRVK